MVLLPDPNTKTQYKALVSSSSTAVSVLPLQENQLHHQIASTNSNVVLGAIVTHARTSLSQCSFPSRLAQF